MTSPQDKAKKFVIVTGAGVVSLLPVAARADENQAVVEAVKPDSAASGDLQTNVRNIINALLLLIGIVAVVMLIIGGFRYVVSSGNEKNTKAAQETILYAVIGIVVALLSFVIVNFVLGQFTA